MTHDRRRAALFGWASRNRFALDVAFALLVTVISVVAMVTSEPSGSERDADVAGVLLVVAPCVALSWRRVAPLTTVAVVTPLVIVFWVLDYDTEFDPVALLALYAAAAHGVDRRRTWRVVGACVVAMTVTVLIGLIAVEEELTITQAVGVGINLATTAVIGEVVYNRRQRLRELEARAERAEQEREASARQAVIDERSRIARELHDVVAHGMSVMVVQAGAARRVLGVDPEQAAEALMSIEETGRSSLAEMRRLLGVLRRSDEGGERAPQPTMSDIGALVANTAEAGVPTELEIFGGEWDLPAGIELATYRLVQEALTNVVKHAGRATARVVIIVSEQHVEIDVTDDGRGAVATRPETVGHGLIGMRERVDVYGGTLDVGPRVGGGYRVHAVLPLNRSERVHASLAG